MHVAVEGIFRDGKVELLESPPDPGEARVIVTFLPMPPLVALADRGVDPEQAADLRGRLRTFAADWDRPDMDVYDDL